MINKIETPTPVLDKYSNHLKQIVHKELIIHQNLEMTQTVEIVFFENVNGTFGRPLLDVIADDQTLTAQERYQYSERYKTTVYQSRTASNYVDSTTGELVDPDNLPEGVTAIKELEFWQNLPEAAFANADGKLSSRVYAAISFSITKMIERNRV